MTDVPETSELRAFVAISDLGSVSGAAGELGLPRATVSRRLARLEDRLGVRLIHRTTRRLQLTDSGEELYAHARAILAAVDQATVAVQRDTSRPRGLLRVSLPPIRNAAFADMLVDFLVEYPDVELEVHATTAYVDLIASNIDAALRAAPSLDPSLIARRLLRSHSTAVAAPEYLAGAGVPESPDDLAQHRCLVGFARGERPSTHWPLRDGGRVRVRGALVSNSMELLHQAAVRGQGIAMLPHLFVVRELSEGTLEAVLPDVVGTDTEVSIVYPDRRLLKPAVRAFVDHCVAWVAREGLGPRIRPQSRL